MRAKVRNVVQEVERSNRSAPTSDLHVRPPFGSPHRRAVLLLSVLICVPTGPSMLVSAA
jgi:hypothetical protein